MKNLKYQILFVMEAILSYVHSPLKDFNLSIHGIYDKVNTKYTVAQRSEFINTLHNCIEVKTGLGL